MFVLIFVIIVIVVVILIGSYVKINVLVDFDITKCNN
jgi:hypothetical protein